MSGRGLSHFYSTDVDAGTGNGVLFFGLSRSHLCCMAKYLSDIVTYFECLCKNHPLLTHDEYPGYRVFEVMAYEDALSDFKTAGREKSYFVRFILPTMLMKPNGNNAIKKYQAGLMVGRYYSTREDAKTEMVLAWSDAERIADDFMARIAYDSRDGHELFYHTVDHIDNLDVKGDFLPSMGDGSFAAVLYTFDFGVFRCVDPEGSAFPQWLDLQ